MNKLNLKLETMNKTIRKTSALGLIMLLTMALSAQPRGYNSQRGGQGYNQGFKGQQQSMNCTDRWAARLDLTEDQTVEMDKLRTGHQKKMLPMRNQMQEKRARLNTLETESPANMKAINSLIDEMASLKADMMKERTAHQQSIRNVLTDEQRVQFDMHKGQRGRGGKGRMQGSRGRGNGYCRY